jgi:phosphotransferase system  glucose/maltose/N-acetylglucosamine-specific IIC component
MGLAGVRGHRTARPDSHGRLLVRQQRQADARHLSVLVFFNFSYYFTFTYFYVNKKLKNKNNKKNIFT